MPGLRALSWRMTTASRREDGDEARVEDARPSVEASVLGDERLHLQFDGRPTRVPDPRVVHEKPQELHLIFGKNNRTAGLRQISPSGIR